MRLKAKHLRHPFRTMATAKVLLKTYLDVKLFPYRSRLRYRGDPRYKLQNITEGFASRIDNSDNDEQLLERICAAYIKAAEHQEAARKTYQPSRWWTEQRQERLQPVTQALRKRDIRALRLMYRNFYRDSCSSGLVARSGMPWANGRKEMRNIDGHFYLGDSLCGIDHWKVRTRGRFAIADLAGPNIGNPFGVMVDGMLVRFKAPYQHYCAHRLSTLLDAGPASVAEIGGGFGGMAYFLLRDRQLLTYFDFDLPETIALASYFLMKAFPALNFVLYGEKELKSEEMAGANVVLMPLFQLGQMPPRSVDVAFSSFAVSSVAAELMSDYVESICRVTRGHFLCIAGGKSGANTILKLATQRKDVRVVETCVSAWNGHKSTNWNDVETLYRIGESQLNPKLEYAIVQQ